MSFLSSIETFFHKPDPLGSILHGVSHLVDIADPIILGVENEVKVVIAATGDQSRKLESVGKFLARYEPDVEKVKEVAENLIQYAPADLYRAIASYAVSKIVPSAEQRMVNLAIELAYNLFESRQS